MTDALLNAYQAVEALSTQMLQAAEAADWPAFAEASQACTRRIDALRQRTANPATTSLWNAAQASQKHAIMLRILRHDAQIRRLRAGALPQPAPSPLADPGFSAYPLPANGGLLH